MKEHQKQEELCCISSPSVWHAKGKTSNFNLSFCWTLKLMESQSHCYFQSYIFLTIPLVTFCSRDAVSLFLLSTDLLFVLFSTSLSSSWELFSFVFFSVGLFYSSTVKWLFERHLFLPIWHRYKCLSLIKSLEH